GHGSGDVHQAEHHGPGAGVRLLDQQVVAQVEGVEEGDPVDARPQLLDLLFQRLNVDEIVRLLTAQHLQFALGFAQPRPACDGQGATAGLDSEHSGHHVDSRGVDLIAEAGAHRAEVVKSDQVELDQIKKNRNLEHEVVKLYLGYVGHIFGRSFTGVACFAA